MASVANAGPRGQETVSVATRMTKEGRRLSYQLTVIQQPERARACGSGAKSSADRRPVDPPPIVGLRVFEGEDGALQDITFSYKANFFLFATLESARPIAQGRVPQTTPAFPVLTGMFVSGMAYLDRPMPAGYFLFPDLSVRHEGKYRLSFNLYEETKDPKDADADPSEQARAARARARLPGPHAPQAFVDWRLEVKSKPFTVFSAKKFPGLAESTSLSRIVAEQGCRVRIRRDVRMRRRGDTKPAPSAAFDEPDDDEDEMDPDDVDHADDAAEKQALAPATPGPDSYRRADGSTSGVDPSRHMTAGVHGRDATAAGVPPPPPPAAPYGLDGARRQSMPEGTSYAPPPVSYPRSYPAPPVMPPHASDPYGAVMDAPPASAYHPPPTHHHHAYAAGPPPPPPPAPSSHPSMGYAPPPPSQRYQAPPAVASPHSRHDSLDHLPPSRRPSMTGGHQSLSSISSTGAMYGYPEAGPVRPPSVVGRPYGGPAAASVRRTPTPGANDHPLPPLNVAVAVEPRYASATSSAATASGVHSAPPPPSAASEVSSYQSASASATTEAGRAIKRPYGAVFDASQFDASLRDGMRPSEAAHGAEPLLAADDDEDAVAEAHDMLRLRMQYKRADGTEISRRPPSTG